MSKSEVRSVRSHLKALDRAVAAAIAERDHPFAAGDLAWDEDGSPVTVVVAALVTIADASGRPRAVPASTLTLRKS